LGIPAQNRHINEIDMFKGEIEKLDLPVSAALVREWSGLPEESAGNSCDLTDVAEFAAGESTPCSEDIPETRLS
jgi:hypothetical protein